MKIRDLAGATAAALILTSTAGATIAQAAATTDTATAESGQDEGGFDDWGLLGLLGLAGLLGLKRKDDNRSNNSGSR